MTHVILINRNEDDKHISFPTPKTLTEFLNEVRSLVPDRSWQIFESWER